MYYQGKLVRSLVKFLAGMSVGEVSNSQAVGGVELAHEELAAGLPDRGHLEDGGGGQQDLHILLAHHQLPGVGCSRQCSSPACAGRLPKSMRRVRASASTSCSVISARLRSARSSAGRATTAPAGRNQLTVKHLHTSKLYNLLPTVRLTAWK